MRITESQLRRVIRRTLRESAFEIPPRVSQMARDIQNACLEQGVQNCVAQPFNSGYIGVSISVPGVGEYIYIDQPGKMGLEDQAGGYIYLGRKGKPIGPGPGALFYQRHSAARYGDIDFSDADYHEATEQVLEALQAEIEEKTGAV